MPRRNSNPNVFFIVRIDVVRPDSEALAQGTPSGRVMQVFVLHGIVIHVRSVVVSLVQVLQRFMVSQPDRASVEFICLVLQVLLQFALEYSPSICQVGLFYVSPDFIVAFAHDEIG